MGYFHRQVAGWTGYVTDLGTLCWSQVCAPRPWCCGGAKRHRLGFFETRTARTPGLWSQIFCHQYPPTWVIWAARGHDMINLIWGQKLTISRQPRCPCTPPHQWWSLHHWSEARYSGTLAFMWETRLVWCRHNLSGCDSHLEIVTTHRPAMPSCCFTSLLSDGPLKAFTQPTK